MKRLFQIEKIIWSIVLHTFYERGLHCILLKKITLGLYPFQISESSTEHYISKTV